MDISVYGDIAQPQLDAAVAEAVDLVAELEGRLSTYRSDSELMQLNRLGHLEQASPAVLEVLQQCEDWYRRSGERFSCRLGAVSELWNTAEQQQAMPERIAIRAVAREMNSVQIRIDSAANRVAMDEAFMLDPSGLAKGYIIDRAMQSLRSTLPGAVALKVDIGGDAMYWGKPPGGSWRVGVANPLATADNEGHVATLALDSMAVAASGHHSRYRRIGRRQYSHLLNPRDGWPIANGVSAVVIAEDALTADAIATALSVQTQADGLAWVNSLDNVEALLIAANGLQRSSDGWAAYLADSASREQASRVVLSLDYVLPAFNAGDYYRHYVAIWISDSDRRGLKNLLLLGATERWARENSRWWRRVGRRNPELLDGLARPTRGPGEYSLQWNGLDDFGKPVPEGDYVIHLEAAREHGGHSYQSIPFTLGGDPQTLRREAEGELGRIELHVNVR
jgi:thiamine biosynthesis lipoprotein